MTSVVWCCKLVILTLGKRRQKHCDLEVNVRLCQKKKNAVGVAQLAVCLAYVKPLVGPLALHKFAVTSNPKSQDSERIRIQPPPLSLRPTLAFRPHLKTKED